MPKNYRSKGFQAGDFPIVLQGSGARSYFGLCVQDSDSVKVAFGPSPTDDDFVMVLGEYCNPVWDPNIAPGERIEIRSENVTEPVVIISDTLPVTDDITDAFHLDVDGEASEGCVLDADYIGTTSSFRAGFKVRGGQLLEGSLPIIHKDSSNTIVLSSRGSSMLVRISSIGLDTGNIGTGGLMDRLTEKAAYSKAWSEIEVLISQSTPNSVSVALRFDKTQIFKESFPCTGINGDVPIEYFLGRSGASVNTADIWVKDFHLDGDVFPMDEGAGNTIVSNGNKLATVDSGAFEWSRYPQ